MQIVKFIIVIWLFSNYALTQTLYYSDEYQVKFSSSNIKQQKEDFINEIKYNSFKKIISSILTNEGYIKFTKSINIELVNSFLFSIDINEEKINNNNYYSKIRIAYDNTKIIEYLINNNFNFVPYEPEKYLLIIFDQKLFSENILSKENKFYAYLSNNKYDYFIIPNLDINDRYLIKKEDFLSKKLKNYKKLIDKYNHKNILLVHAKSNLNQVQINSYVYRDDTFINLNKTNLSEINYELFFNNLNNELINYWKNENIVISSKISNIKCRIKTLNLNELKKIKEIINNNIIIKKIVAEEISYNNSTYDLLYYGNQDILIKSLSKNKIELNFKNNNCNIKIL
tara:strand:- start:1311 stop:2333 length:1023 start_codon:yes stop_codon:yes gene_type:complete